MVREDDVSTVLRATSVPATARAFAIEITEGPDAGLAVNLAEGMRVLVGQSPVCEFRLGDPQVSRRHMALENAGDRVRLVDLDSTNGTFVNDVRVALAWLSGGERVQLGDTTMRVVPTARVAVPPAPRASAFGRVRGESDAMQRVYAICERLAASEVPVVIEGETGTGKEVLAEAIHETSERASGPFVVFDCTAVPPSLVESELFGHERGAFTGAVATRIGVFEQAHGGTLLIDEIGDLDPALQPKLLRALERQEVRRVGGDKWYRVDVRILAATRRDLDQAVQEGRFRDDLYFRLAVGRVELPPLRDRSGDVAFLTNHFWRELGGGDAAPYEVVRRFERHPWPGNVRELRNAVARQLALGDGPLEAPPAAAVPKTADSLEALLAMNLPYPRARQLAQAEFERRYLERVLAAHNGNVARAAAASGIARRYFNVILARRRNG
ncbi:MAG TPA: sigma 54-interacting transcriptional regulator [Polyangiaceae bacterium]